MSALEDKLAALRQRFVATAGGQAAELEARLGQGDLDGVRHLAHGLAGRSGMFGFGQLGEQALAVDEADADDLPAQAEALIAALRTLAQDA